MLMSTQQPNAYGFTPVGGRVCQGTDLGKFLGRKRRSSTFLPPLPLTFPSKGYMITAQRRGLSSSTILDSLPLMAAILDVRWRNLSDSRH